MKLRSTSSIRSIRFLILLLISLALLSPSAKAQTFTLDPTQWVIDPQQPDFGQVMPFYKKGSLAFNFSRDTYTGYVLLPYTQPITGSTLVANIQLLTFPDSPDRPVRFVAPDNGTCISPAKLYIFFQTQGLYNGIEGTQWWATVDSWEVVDTLGNIITISVDLTDKSKWYSVYAHPATMFPTEFDNAKAYPTYIGFTIGGNCSNGHGGSPRKGDAQCRLWSFYAQ